MIWLLDSVTIIYALNGQGRCRQHLNSAPTRGRVATSILSVAEVYYGVENSRRREENRLRIDRELELFDIYPVTIETARIYARIRAQAEKAGRTKGPSGKMGLIRFCGHPTKGVEDGHDGRIGEGEEAATAALG